jgi:hypothetical protein
MAKKIAYWALHYGREYLRWSVASVAHAVDELHFLYADRPSYGHSTTLVRPPGDDEQHLFDIANGARGGKPIFWHQGAWANEGEHRSAIYSVAQDVGAEQVLVVDADEVWLPGAVELAFEHTGFLPFGGFGLPFVHFWRSFKWICRDHWTPIRILNVKQPRDRTTIMPALPPVLHFGYAQSLATMRYKWSCHGHKSELRPGWFEEKFLPWPPGKDVHPTTIGIWNPENQELMGKGMLEGHPYWHKEVIE